MVALTKGKKSRDSTTKKGKTPRPPAVEPVPITGRDLKRVAGCTDNQSRWNLGYIELSPVGLCATNGRLLCVLNAPGWPYQFYLEAKDAKCVHDDAELNVNGRVLFVSRKPGGEAELALPHSNPDEVRFPSWQHVLPDASRLQPVATLNIGLLKRLIGSLQRTAESVVTVHVRPDDCLSPVMLCNEAGDLGLLMPIGPDGNETPGSHFPEAVYQALRKDPQTIPAAWIPRHKLPQADDVHASPDGGGLLGD
jgi:hypothetical protein